MDPNLATPQQPNQNANPSMPTDQPANGLASVQQDTYMAPSAPTSQSMPPASSSSPINMGSSTVNMPNNVDGVISQPSTTAQPIPASMPQEAAPQMAAETSVQQPVSGQDVSSAMPTQPNTTNEQQGQMQNPNVFDTTQYHLPIEKPKKHNAGMQMLVFGVVFLVVIIVGGFLAIDAEVIDLGFESPVNIIK